MKWFSQTRIFVIGPPQQIQPPIGDPIRLLSPADGAEFAGPVATIPFAWVTRNNSINRVGLYQVLVRDVTGETVAQQYVRGNSWEAEIDGFGLYTWGVRMVQIGLDGSVTGMGPASEQRKFVIKPDTALDQGRRLGDLVEDGLVDSGDAIRALRHSADPENNRLLLRDMSAGDCNGDGQVDSGDAIYMLRKAVGSTR